jgi:replicative DNA helicase
MAEGRRDPEAEAALLGCVLTDAARTLPLASALLSADDFSERKHRAIWEAVQRVSTQGLAVDRVSVAAQIRADETDAGGDAYLERLEFAALAGGDGETYARIVADLAAARRVGSAAWEIVRLAKNDAVPVSTLMEQASARITAATSSRTAGSKSRSMMDLASDFHDRLETGEPERVVSTGIRRLDKALGGGYGPGQLVVVAGRPAMGKSSLAVQHARAAAASGPVLFASLEMSGRELFGRMACGDAGVEYVRVRNGGVNPREREALLAATAALSRLPIRTSDAMLSTLIDVRAEAHRVRAHEGALAMVVVDYLQLMQAPRGAREDNREQTIASIARGLKLLARELDIPVVALSQLSRKPEERSDKRPMPSDLRESGAIEQDADVIVFPYRDAVYNKGADESAAELIIAKQRNGPSSTVFVEWQGARTRFVDPMEGGSL